MKWDLVCVLCYVSMAHLKKTDQSHRRQKEEKQNYHKRWSLWSSQYWMQHGKKCIKNPKHTQQQRSYDKDYDRKSYNFRCIIRTFLVIIWLVFFFSRSSLSSDDKRRYDDDVQWMGCFSSIHKIHMKRNTKWWICVHCALIAFVSKHSLAHTNTHKPIDSFMSVIYVRRKLLWPVFYTIKKTVSLRIYLNIKKVIIKKNRRILLNETRKSTRKCNKITMDFIENALWFTSIKFSQVPVHYLIEMSINKIDEKTHNFSQAHYVINVVYYCCTQYGRHLRYSIWFINWMLMTTNEVSTRIRIKIYQLLHLR